MLTQVLKYFPNLSAIQKEQLEKLYPIYEDWNSKINVVSRKDFEHFYTRHVLHSLAIAKVIDFPKGCKIVDIGTGGGFPGIPLAIVFSEVEFTLVDSIAKKIRVVADVVDQLNVKNVIAEVHRSENMEGAYNYIVSRAVTQLPKFLQQTKHLLDKNDENAAIYYLKGGDFMDELKAQNMEYSLSNISSYFADPFFETKKVVCLSKAQP